MSCAWPLRSAVTFLVAVFLNHSAYAAGNNKVVVHVVDYAGIDEGSLTLAQHHLISLFGAIALGVQWRDELPRLAIPEAPGDVTVLLLSGEMSTRKAKAETLSDDVLGSATLPPVRRAWIFVDRIKDYSALTSVPFGIALGRVIAHEIGHMVGISEHAGNGLMQRMLKPDHAIEGFTLAQRDQMLATLRGAPTMAWLRPHQLGDPPRYAQLPSWR